MSPQWRTLDQVDATYLLRPRGDRRRPIGVSTLAGNVGVKAIVIKEPAPTERLVAIALLRSSTSPATEAIAKSALNGLRQQFS